MSKAPTQPDSAAEPRTGYSTDQPIRTFAQDRFARAAFAHRVADTIVTRTDAAGMVLGLYGPWGDGKTSVLLLIEEHLKDRPGVVVVRFNPWHFTSEDQLMRGFFSTLASALGAKLTRRTEEIGQALKDYGALLSVVNGGDAATGLGERLSSTTLDQLKARVEDFLREAGTHVVVLIDDIDRLDRAETHLIFKLVKLSAGFERTTYLLAFDDAVVAAALGERYGSGGDAAGRAFLEKIIQVPLHLPAAEPVALRKLAFDGINAALHHAGIDLPRAQADAFVVNFTSGLEASLTTPRQAHLYANSLLFSLPLVKGEVNIPQFMLVEALRLFHPALHRALRDNPTLLLSGRESNQEQRQQQISRLIEASTPQLTLEERERLFNGPLSYLFPRMGRMGYGPEWEAEWAREQRICADSYFHKYFAYGASISELSDRRVQAFLDALPEKASAEQDAALRELATPEAVASLVQRLRQHELHLPADAVPALAATISRNGGLFPLERGAFSNGGPRTQAAILVYHLIKSVPDRRARLHLASTTLRQAEPLHFVGECLNWLSPNPRREPEAEWVLSQEAFDEVHAFAVRERIVPSDAQEPLYRQLGLQCRTCYWWWHKFDADGVRARVHACLDTAPDEVDYFLDAFVGEAWELATGLSHRSDLRRETYDEIARLADPSDIAQRLRARHGAVLDEPRFHHGNEVAMPLRIAHQFMVVHRAAAQEATVIDPPYEAPEPTTATEGGPSS